MACSKGFDWQLVGMIPCIDAPLVEQTLHRWLDDSRVMRGREWFVLSDDEAHTLVAVFKAYSEGGSSCAAPLITTAARRSA